MKIFKSLLLAIVMFMALFSIGCSPDPEQGQIWEWTYKFETHQYRVDDVKNGYVESINLKYVDNDHKSIFYDTTTISGFKVIRTQITNITDTEKELDSRYWSIYHLSDGEYIERFAAMVVTSDTENTTNSFSPGDTCYASKQEQMDILLNDIVDICDDNIVTVSYDPDNPWQSGSSCPDRAEFKMTYRQAKQWEEDRLKILSRKITTTVTSSVATPWTEYDVIGGVYYYFDGISWVEQPETQEACSKITQVEEPDLDYFVDTAWEHIKTSKELYKSGSCRVGGLSQRFTEARIGIINKMVQCFIDKGYSCEIAPYTANGVYVDISW